MIEWKDFNYKYANNKHNYSSRSEYLEYFKQTYPQEYRKYRDYLNKNRKQYYQNLKVHNPEKYNEERLKHKKRLNIRYHNNKEYYKNYYKEYINRPGNREKNRIRTNQWYQNNKAKLIYDKAFKDNKVKKVKNEDKSKNKIKQNKTSFIIDFEL